MPDIYFYSYIAIIFIVFFITFLFRGLSENSLLLATGASIIPFIMIPYFPMGVARVFSVPWVYIPYYIVVLSMFVQYGVKFYKSDGALFKLILAYIFLSFIITFVSDSSVTAAAYWIVWVINFLTLFTVFSFFGIIFFVGIITFEFNFFSR